MSPACADNCINLNFFAENHFTARYFQNLFLSFQIKDGFLKPNAIWIWLKPADLLHVSTSVRSRLFLYRPPFPFSNPPNASFLSVFWEIFTVSLEAIFQNCHLVLERFYQNNQHLCQGILSFLNVYLFSRTSWYFLTVFHASERGSDTADPNFEIYNHYVCWTGLLNMKMNERE